MDVIWTDFFWDILDLELDREGRPSRDDFMKLLMPGVDLTLRTFWGDETVTPLVDDDTEQRSVRTGIVQPQMFPPGAVYAVPLDDDQVAVIGVSFDWDYWHDVYHEDIH